MMGQPDRKQKASPAQKDPHPLSSPSKDQAPPPSKPLARLLGDWAFPVFLVLALYSFFQKNNPLGVALMGLAVASQIFKARSWSPSWLGKITHSSGRGRALSLLGILLALWMGFSMELLTFPAYRWMVPKMAAFPFQYLMGVLLVFWVGMVVVLRLLPEPASEDHDLSPWMSGFFLLLTMGVFSFLALYHAEAPAGVNEGDSAVYPAIASRAFDLADYRMLYQSGVGDSWDPFYPLLMDLIWHLKPDLPIIWMARVVSWVSGLGGILFLYLAGREIFNRRTGIFVAALASVSLPLLMGIAGTMNDAHFMPVGLVIWLFFRALRRPKLLSFLFWGAAVAFCVYARIFLRIHVLFFIFGGLLYILFNKKEEREIQKPVLWVVGGTAALFFSYMLFTNSVYATNSFPSHIISSTGSWFPCMILGVFLFLAIAYAPVLTTSLSQYPYLRGWTAGAWLCMILTFPKMWEINLLGKMIQLGVTGHSLVFKPLKIFTFLFDRVESDVDTGIYLAPGNAFFGYSEVILGALGLALVIAKPNLKRLFLLAAFGTGFGAYLMTDKYMAFRLLPSIGPLLLLAAFGLNYLWSVILSLTSLPMMRGALFGLLIGFWSWTGQGVFDKVFGQWADKYYRLDAGIRQSAVEDVKKGFRVYLGPAIGHGFDNFIFYENNPVYLLKAANPLFVGSRDKPPDLVVYLSEGENQELDAGITEKIKKTFPNAKWTDIRNPYYEREEALAFRCQIPYSDVLSADQDLFKIQNIGPSYWTRTYFTGMPFGFRPSVVDWEDKTPSINDPPPPSMDMYQRVFRYQGTIHVAQDGNYRISCTVSNRIKINLDNRRIFDFVFPFFRENTYPGPDQSGTITLPLKAGDHQVEILTCFQRSKDAPAITLCREGSGEKEKSLWSSFEF